MQHQRDLHNLWGTTYSAASTHAIQPPPFMVMGRSCAGKPLRKQPLLVKGISRDGDLTPIEQFLCYLHGTPEQPTVNHVRLQLFGKAKKGLEILPPTIDALELHTERANYHEAKIWLKTHQEHIGVPSPIDTAAWKESGYIEAVWTRLPPIPDACLELVTCGCKLKCRIAQCTCFKKGP